MSYLLPLLIKLSRLPFISPSPQVGWLDDFTGWLAKIWRAIWHAFVDFLVDFVLIVVKIVGTAFSYVISLIPVPDFLTNNTVGGLLGGAGPVIGWLATQMQLSTALGFIAAGYAFRLTRKFFTLGQW
jgi:hypothetical protein